MSPRDSSGQQPPGLRPLCPLLPRSDHRPPHELQGLLGRRGNLHDVINSDVMCDVVKGGRVIENHNLYLNIRRFVLWASEAKWNLHVYGSTNISEHSTDPGA